MHATPRRRAALVTLAPACLLLALLAVTTDVTRVDHLASQASAATATTAGGIVDTGARVVARDLVPSGAGAGLLLVASGLLVLAPLTSTLLLGGVLRAEALPRGPVRPRAVETASRLPRRDAAPVAYRGPRDDEFRRGRLAGLRLGARDLDDLMDRLVEAEMGEPRITRSVRNLMRIRLDGCRGCDPAAHGVATMDGVAGCAFECGLLEGALGDVLDAKVVVHEVACRAQGAPACEFEVWH